MARPKIFLSSTFYDLRQVRTDLDRFIRDMGYDPVRNERGAIPYGKEEKLEEYCLKEIGGIDIMVSIIGGRYGTPSAHGDSSISQMEIKTALKQDKQLFIFIDKNVYAEFRTYQSNKGNDKVKYHYVDNIKVYEFIEFLEGLPRNNPIQPFESSDEIATFLKEQWAGLFQRFLQEQRRLKEQDFLQGLEATANTLNQLINFLKAEKEGSETAVRDIIISNHPIFERIRKLLKVPYRIFFLTRNELNLWLKARSFDSVEPFAWDNHDEEEWNWDADKKRTLLKINSNLFDQEGKLKPIQSDQWKDTLVRIEETDISAKEDDLPF